MRLRKLYAIVGTATVLMLMGLNSQLAAQEPQPVVDVPRDGHAIRQTRSRARS
jgi:hypothetical protein